MGGEGAGVPSGGACERPGARVRGVDMGAGGESGNPEREAAESEKGTGPIRGPIRYAKDDCVFLRSACEYGGPSGSSLCHR